MQRVQGEKSRHDRASPRGTGYPFQKQEKKKCVRGMDERVYEQMATGLKTEDLAVEHMGEPGERMPACGMKRREGPSDPVQGQAVDDHRVVPDVVIVVVVDELMGSGPGRKPPA